MTGFGTLAQFDLNHLNLRAISLRFKAFFV